MHWVTEKMCIRKKTLAECDHNKILFFRVISQANFGPCLSNNSCTKHSVAFSNQSYVFSYKSTKEYTDKNWKSIEIVLYFGRKEFVHVFVIMVIMVWKVKSIAKMSTEAQKWGSNSRHIKKYWKWNNSGGPL